SSGSPTSPSANAPCRYPSCAARSSVRSTTSRAACPTPTTARCCSSADARAASESRIFSDPRSPLSWQPQLPPPARAPTKDPEVGVESQGGGDAKTLDEGEARRVDEAELLVAP